MTKEQRNDVKFYVCLVMAFSLLLTSLFLPPLNIITESVLYASIIILGTGALVTGVDVSGIIHEVRLLKEVNVKLLTKDKEEPIEDEKV